LLNISELLDDRTLIIAMIATHNFIVKDTSFSVSVNTSDVTILTF